MTLDEMLAKAGAKPRRKASSDEEHRLQEVCVRWFNIQVPNGGRRDAVTGAKLKAEGVVAGVSDLILLKSTHRFGALLIEMKTPKGRQSEHQRWWQSVICDKDEYKYVVCRSLDDFIREVRCYLNDSK